MKLPGQAKNGEEAEYAERHVVSRRGQSLAGLRQAVDRSRAHDEVAEAVKQTKGDERSDRHEGDQLEHRSEGQRQHHAGPMAGGIHLPGTKQDREQRKCGRNPGGGITGSGLGSGSGGQRLE